MTQAKKLKVVFAPGCFDDFEGTQEELDALVKEIQDQCESGQFFEEAVDLEDMTEEEIKDLTLHITGYEKTTRTLQ